MGRQSVAYRPASQDGHAGTPYAFCSASGEWIMGGTCPPVDCGPLPGNPGCASTTLGTECSRSCEDGRWQTHALHGLHFFDLCLWPRTHLL